MKTNKFFKSKRWSIFWRGFITALPIILTIVAYLCANQNFKDFFEAHFICVSIIVLLLSALAGLITFGGKTIEEKNLQITKLQQTQGNIQGDNDVSDLIDFLRKELENKNYEEVITVGQVLDRTLFTIGKYEMRLKIGEIVKEAARFRYKQSEGNVQKQDKYKEIEMTTLIDSIGWMKVELGRSKKGRKDIEDGKLIAESFNTDKGKSYVARANRHLGSIERRLGDYPKAFSFHNQSIEKAKEIENEQLKIEAIAAAYYAMAFVYNEQKDYANAVKYAKDSILEFNKLEDGDKKTMKVCMTTEIHARFLFYSVQKRENDYNISEAEKTSKILEAEKIFDEALTTAVHHTFRLEMVRCYIGFSEINLHFADNSIGKDRKGYIDKVKSYINKAKNVKIDCKDDQDRINDIERRINDIEGV